MRFQGSIVLNIIIKSKINHDILELSFKNMLKNMYSMALLPPYNIANGLAAAVKYLSVNRLHDHDGCLFLSLCGNIIIFLCISSPHYFVFVSFLNTQFSVSSSILFYLIIFVESLFFSFRSVVITIVFINIDIFIVVAIIIIINIIIITISSIIIIIISIVFPNGPL